MTVNRTDALERLDVLVGEWFLAARFPGDQPGASGPRAPTRFEWTLDRQFLLQRTEAPVPQAPSSLTVVGVDPETGAYTQHYYDSRGVARLYAMTLTAGVWTLTRESPDFSPLDFAQRFIGTFSQDGNTITGGWDKRADDGGWKRDFDLNYHRVG
jgi:hypothetical protein